MNSLEYVLSEKGLLEESIHEMRVKDSSWFIVLFHAIGGVLSALLFMLLFAFPLHDLLDEPILMLIMGCIVLGFSYVSFSKGKSDFLEYFALMFALLGESLILFALGELFYVEEKSAILGVMLIYMVLFFLFSSSVHRFLSAYVVLFAGAYFATLYHVDFLYVGMLFLLSIWLWLHEYDYLKYIHHLRMLGYALVSFFLFFHGLTESFIFEEFRYTLFGAKTESESIFQYFYLLVYYGVGLGAMAMIYLKHKEKPNYMLFILLMLGTGVFYWIQPLGMAIAQAMTILLLSFTSKNRLLMGLALMAMFHKLFSYYFLMFIDFISKSWSLLFFGVGVLLLAYILHLYLKQYEGVVDA